MGSAQSTVGHRKVDKLNHILRIEDRNQQSFHVINISSGSQAVFNTD